MTDYLLKDLPSKGDNCVACNSGKAFRIKGLDPMNRQFVICVDCLVGKICEQIKGGKCESKELNVPAKPELKAVPVSEVKPAEAT